MRFRAVYNIVDLSLYGNALVCSLLVSRRHNDATKSAWTGLFIWSALRIAAAATSLADTFNPGSSLGRASTIMDPVTIVVILYTPTVLLARIHATMWQQRAPQKYFWLVIFFLIPAFVVGLIGGLNVTSDGTSDPAKGWTRLQVSGALSLIVLTILIAVTTFNLLRYSHVPRSEVRLLYAVALALLASILPVIFGLVAAAAKERRFYWTPDEDTGLILSIAMITVPEVVALAAYLWAGLTVKLPVTDSEEDTEDKVARTEVLEVGNANDDADADTAPSVQPSPGQPPAYTDAMSEGPPRMSPLLPYPTSQRSKTDRK